MANTFFKWEEFVSNFGKEMVSASDVFDRMAESGLRDFCLAQFDCHFVSNNIENLRVLNKFLVSQYGYATKSIKEIELGRFELHCTSNNLSITKENLLYWALDMYSKGYSHDCVLEAYGALFDPNNLSFPDLSETKEDYYYEKGIEFYNLKNYSEAIINWTLAIKLDPLDPDLYYCRAIAKNDLYTWKSAMKDYDRAIELAPDFAKALNNRGALKDENNDYLGAIEDYNTVIKLSNASVKDKQMAFFNKGNTKLKINDRVGACQDWNTAYGLGATYALSRIREHC
ncbi:tetratricopeptide repeat protein [Lewinella sp. 4G2]|uniref:tetratricopeptide repeat protein n=1 Tax=Lewinella sp. 4G2 TaxID=1803372 RepID=UPI0007B48BA7|nr:tetratricopeptide repeat protein [Lewinella sp. 4G2]OAV45072.1 hypothetical protein A3850_011500 [Lewinella sp. 4G2]